MNILRYFFLLPLMIISCGLKAENDTLFVPSVRIGLDVSGVARQFVEPETITGEISVDVEWQNNYFAALEAGMMTVDVEKETHRYQADGYFFRLGADFNILGRTPQNPHDLVLLSVRYGYSALNHEAPFIVIPDPFWGNYQTAVPAHRYRAHWIEAGLGLKTHLFHNIFIGWSLRGRLLLTSTKEPAMEPYFIGGFGKSNGNTNLMLHYLILYRIPLR